MKTNWTAVEKRQLVIFALVAFALPYLLGGTLGGWLGGRWFQKTWVDWLRRLFGALLIWGGVRCLL